MAQDKIRIACISDTHDIYYPEIPEVDAIIHAGDISLSGSKDETLRFLKWFDSLPIKHKLFIGGNHDAWLERYGPAILPDYKTIQMLWNSSYDLEGYKVWGSPVSAAYGHIKAFAIEREEIEESGFWDRIPMDTEILVTHGPARGIGDQAKFSRSEHLGDSALLQAIDTIKPMLHVYGHIHGSRGKYQFCWIDGADQRGFSVNAAVLNEAYFPWHDNKITVIELVKKDGNSSGDGGL